MTAAEYIPIIVARIVEPFTPEQIILFGSQARRTAHPLSDIDIIVVLPDVEDPFATNAAIRRALLDSPFPLDIVVTTPEDLEIRQKYCGDVLYYARKEAQELYQRCASVQLPSTNP